MQPRSKINSIKYTFFFLNHTHQERREELIDFLELAKTAYQPAKDTNTRTGSEICSKLHHTHFPKVQYQYRPRSLSLFWLAVAHSVVRLHVCAIHYEQRRPLSAAWPCAAAAAPAGFYSADTENTAALPRLSAARLPQTPFGAAGERNRDPQTSGLSLPKSTTRIFITALQFRHSSERLIFFLTYNFWFDFREYFINNPIQNTHKYF